MNPFNWFMSSKVRLENFNALKEIIHDYYDLIPIVCKITKFADLNSLPVHKTVEFLRICKIIRKKEYLDKISQGLTFETVEIDEDEK